MTLSNLFDKLLLKKNVIKKTLSLFSRYLAGTGCYIRIDGVKNEFCVDGEKRGSEARCAVSLSLELEP